MHAVVCSDVVREQKSGSGQVRGLLFRLESGLGINISGTSPTGCYYDHSSECQFPSLREIKKRNHELAKIQFFKQNIFIYTYETEL